MGYLKKTDGTPIRDTEGNLIYDTEGIDNVMVSDSGSGVDALPSTSISLSLAESGAAVDSVAAVDNSVLIPITDSAAAVDIIRVLGVLYDTKGAPLFDTLGRPLFDTGADFVGVQVADSASGSDTLNLAAALGLTETGTGADVTGDASVQALVADSVAASDTLSATIYVSLAETGLGAELVSYLVSAITISDVFVGTDIAVVGTESSKAVADLGSGTELLPITVSCPLTDSGSGVDSIAQLLNSFLLIETAGATENLTAQVVSYVKTIVEAGTGASTIGVSAAIVVSDIGAASDVISQVLSRLSISDAGSGVDVAIMATPRGSVRVTFTAFRPKVEFSAS